MIERPPRSAEEWFGAYHELIDPLLVEGMRILDVGSGRRPSIPIERRPPACHYVGLDLSMTELQLAPIGSYDELYVADVTEHIPRLVGEFDLVVSWQVLEHVKPLEVAVENIYTYLRPGGWLVTQMSGKFSVFGLINQLIPQRIAVWLLQRLLQRDPRTVFPAYYDRCWYGALRRMLQSWSAWEIRSRFWGRGYFAFSRRLQRAYVLYENWAARGGHENLATHYLLAAQR